MLKYAVVFAAAGILTMGASNRINSSASNAGPDAWRVDTEHSDAQLITDATTDYGKQKINATLGFARVNGDMRLSDSDPTQSSVDLEMYPATGAVAPMEDGTNFLSEWLTNVANHTLICFHSKNLQRTSDGRLQSTGNLVLTRVDRNIIQSNANEAYSGPVYGPPMVHRVMREATFIFDIPAAAQKDGRLRASATTSMYRENFPQLVMSAIRTSWPPLVQNERCTNASDPLESYSGPQCTGTVLHAPPLPQPPHAAGLTDFPGAPNYNAIVGNQLTIQLHLRFSPSSAGKQMAAGE